MKYLRSFTEFYLNSIFNIMTLQSSPMPNWTCLPHLTLKPWDVIGPLMIGLVGGPGLSGLVVQTKTSLGELFPSTLEANSWNKKNATNLTLLTVMVFLTVLYNTSFSNYTNIINLESMSLPKIACGILLTADCQRYFFRNYIDFSTPSTTT